jgi:large subunit ribosomal protein L15e
MLRKKSDELKSIGIELRRNQTIERIERPTRLDRARRLGYKAKSGFIIVRVKVGRGGMRRTKTPGGRRPKHAGIVKMKSAVNMRQTAENRAMNKYPNMKTLNSYFLYKDGKNAWYEVILIDPVNPSVKTNKNISRITIQD